MTSEERMQIEDNRRGSVGGRGAVTVASCCDAVGVVNPFARAQAEDEEWTGLDSEQGSLLGTN